MIETAVWALVPVILLIGLGNLLRRSEFLESSFWSQAERACYYLLLPALFFHGLTTADINDLPIWNLAGVLLASTLLVATLVFLAKPLMRVSGGEFTSVFQGSIRFNNYIGVTVAAGVYGTEGIAFAALCNAVLVPTVNLLCVVVLSRFGSMRLTVLRVLKQVVTNPLILACVAGILMQTANFGLPPGIEPTLNYLGGAAMPLGLLCVGAALQFTNTRAWVRPIALASIAKFVVLPAVTFLVAYLVGLGSQGLVIAMLFQALPTASSSYILSRQLGGDAPLMAGTIAVQTLLGMLVLPVVLILVSL